MSDSPRPLRERAAWQALREHADTMRLAELRTLFADDPRRGEELTAEAAGLRLDYSKQRLDEETLRLLVALAEQSGLRERTLAMFAGDRINTTEDRPVLHVALRAPRGESIVVDGRDVVSDVHEVLDRMAAFCERVRSGGGRARRGSGSAPWSTSESEARTSGR